MLRPLATVCSLLVLPLSLLPLGLPGVGVMILASTPLARAVPSPAPRTDYASLYAFSGVGHIYVGLPTVFTNWFGPGRGYTYWRTGCLNKAGKWVADGQPCSLFKAVRETIGVEAGGYVRISSVAEGDGLRPCYIDQSGKHPLVCDNNAHSVPTEEFTFDGVLLGGYWVATDRPAEGSRDGIDIWDGEVKTGPWRVQMRWGWGGDFSSERLHRPQPPNVAVPPPPRPGDAQNAAFQGDLLAAPGVASLPSSSTSAASAALASSLQAKSAIEQLFHKAAGSGEEKGGWPTAARELPKLNPSNGEMRRHHAAASTHLTRSKHALGSGGDGVPVTPILSSSFEGRRPSPPS
ncbi:MAG: hypothetical protein M1826_005771 [Phylliscum demangeonii]|nr:MAG: hypothetical protein M1826_005771 [Phylliscum demangeonii]